MTAYDQGREAHRRSIPIDECPYPEGAFDRDQWRAGWFHVHHGIEPPDGVVLNPPAAEMVAKGS